MKNRIINCVAKKKPHSVGKKKTNKNYNLFRKRDGGTIKCCTF